MVPRNPLVSAVIPVYNGERFLADTIESVLTQTYANIECIVVNDGSTDATAKIAQSFGGKIRYLEKPNGGVSSARNLGIESANGEYVAFLDADDLWFPLKIEKQVEAFRRANGIGMIYCGVKFVDEDKRVVGEDHVVAHDELIGNILLLERSAGFIPCTGLVVKSIFGEIGNFDQKLSTSADADFVCRLSIRYKIDSVPEPLAMYRRHGNQMHHNVAALEHDMKIVLERVFARSDLPSQIAGLRLRAYSSLESTLAIGFFSQGQHRKGLSHLGKAFKYGVLTAFKKLGKVVAAKF